MYQFNSFQLVFMFMFLFLVACGEGLQVTSGREEAPNVSEQPDTSIDSTSDEGSHAEVYDKIAAKQVTTHTIETSEGLRYYKIYGPSESMQGRPVLLFLHGGGQSMAILEPEVGGEALRKIADRDNILIVVPNGTDGETGSFYSPEDDKGNLTSGQRWHDDTIEGLLPKVEAVDDVAFLSDLIKSLHDRYGTDKNRTYIAGVSNGGFMTQKMLIEAPGLFAAAGAGLALTPEPYKVRQVIEPVPLVLWVGSEDRQTTDLGHNSDLLSVILQSPIETLSWWAYQLGAQHPVAPVQVSTPDRSGCYTTLERFEGQSPVHLYVSQGGGHALPSRSFPTTNRNQCKDIDGLDEMWKFMFRFSQKDVSQ